MIIARKLVNRIKTCVFCALGLASLLPTYAEGIAMPGFLEVFVTLIVLVGAFTVPKLRKIQIDFKKRNKEDDD